MLQIVVRLKKKKWLMKVKIRSITMELNGGRPPRCSVREPWVTGTGYPDCSERIDCNPDCPVGNIWSVLEQGTFNRGLQREIFLIFSVWTRREIISKPWKISAASWKWECKMTKWKKQKKKKNYKIIFRYLVQRLIIYIHRLNTRRLKWVFKNHPSNRDRSENFYLVISGVESTEGN